jgi:hypothetical protein
MGRTDVSGLHQSIQVDSGAYIFPEFRCDCKRNYLFPIIALSLLKEGPKKAAIRHILPHQKCQFYQNLDVST